VLWSRKGRVRSWAKGGVWVKACLRYCVSACDKRLGERLCVRLGDLKFSWLRHLERLSERLREMLGEWMVGCSAIGWVRCWIQPCFKFTSGKLGERLVEMIDLGVNLLDVLYDWLQ
jgi:hypothetical protein